MASNRHFDEILVKNIKETVSDLHEGCGLIEDSIRRFDDFPFQREYLGEDGFESPFWRHFWKESIKEIVSGLCDDRGAIEDSVCPHKIPIFSPQTRVAHWRACLSQEDYTTQNLSSSCCWSDCPISLRVKIPELLCCVIGVAVRQKRPWWRQKLNFLLIRLIVDMNNHTYQPIIAEGIPPYTTYQKSHPNFLCFLF